MAVARHVAPGRGRKSFVRSVVGVGRGGSLNPGHGSGSSSSSSSSSSRSRVLREGRSSRSFLREHSPDSLTATTFEKRKEKIKRDKNKAGLRLWRTKDSRPADRRRQFLKSVHSFARPSARRDKTPEQKEVEPPVKSFCMVADEDGDEDGVVTATKTSEEVSQSVSQSQRETVKVDSFVTCPYSSDSEYEGEIENVASSATTPGQAEEEEEEEEEKEEEEEEEEEEKKLAKKERTTTSRRRVKRRENGGATGPRRRPAGGQQRAERSKTQRCGGVHDPRAG
ncbi:hypothetical protein K0M31_011231 [Melipona bicolor]|uniref:Uncharacterized protein n=1 Tax=Melipona bicolor TaxID=60889 RepID=A0AA40G953_9HYME|nr:hypothetical protein K0M31_011231 [Melipona bicolor]